MSMSYAPHKLRPPEGLEELLWSFAKEVLRDQPKDIVKYGAQYFRAAYNERENPSAPPPPKPVTIVRETPTEAETTSSVQTTPAQASAPPMETKPAQPAPEAAQLPPKPQAPPSQASAQTEPEKPATPAQTEHEVQKPTASVLEPESKQSKPSPPPLTFDQQALLRKIAPNEASKEALAIIKDKDQMKSLWNQVDFNNNGIVSLAELDKLVVEKGWNISKPALMRAYKKTTLKDGDGDAWVEKKEFAAFMRNMFFFDRLWDVFDDIDTGDDRRIDVGEFKAGMEKLGSRLSDDEAQAEFAKIDRNGGGQILFKEFCHYVAGLVGAALEGDKAAFQEDTDRAAKKPGSAGATEASKEGAAEGSEAKPAAAPVAAKDGLNEEGLLARLGLDEASKEALAIIKDKDQMKSLWNQVDFNNNGIVSLAELDKLVVEKGWNISKPALMRAYKKTTLKDGDGDAWVEKKEFAAFMRNMFFFDRLWDVFDDIDTGDDRRIDVGEFKAGMEKLGSRLSDDEAQAEFAKIDRNGGGQILFVEFCNFIASLVGVDLEEFTMT
ncbi:hypothetical protein PTSG_00602 [Salpingoeca rosetta]|uniref:EF-hand domain-containing protein n=1 Tax=Salpingoeca rosetta (strain ATCC 50818 / BSB-021) TaxID=946362 RepID=F2TWY3_SALR5|nr:uncharacterized protein PTSG_00602 [Salpingoeca rosetta]EGD75892.1 hypothetical protein PTSG_00602 [Salpingoeca rosetta]|eukprot:XP_004998068.1 hypothetical protein PTSG_00602 [Salpingoeca rosetta]